MRHARPMRLPKKHKIVVACVAAAAVVGLSVAGVEATGGMSAAAVGDPTGLSASTGDQAKSAEASDRAAAQKHAAAVAAAKKKMAAEAAAQKHAAAVAAAKKKAATEAATKEKAAAEAAKRAREKVAANRSTTRTAVKPTAAPVKAPPPVIYANNLDGWIRQALSIMAVHGIPGTYNGIYRNIMRESSGNPNAINLWDSNAAAGTPSKGLLQTIQPTFNAYHVAGTSWNIYDPVANITAACNYAWHLYGSIDNVNGPY